MICQLDHVNISVADIDRTVAFLRIAFPELRIRGGGKGQFGEVATEWLHLGLDELYVSINTANPIEEREKPHESAETGINHVGFIVEDRDDLLSKYQAAGFTCEPVDELPSRKRLYVADGDHIIWEFIQYLSDDFGVRNDYSI
jgi:catechol 2,3-dioxygenase-like lactoylglutathione lyase family enzyme